MKPKSIASLKAFSISSGRDPRSVRHLSRFVKCLTLFLFIGPFILAFADYDEGMEAYRKAWGAFSSQRYEDARQLTMQAIKADPSNPHAHALAGDLAYLAHDLEGARRAWKQALAAEPRLRPVKERLVQLEQEERLEIGQVLQQTGLFRISTPPEISQRTVDYLQAAQAFLEQQFQIKLSGPITVLVYEPEIVQGSLHMPAEVAGLFDGKIRLPFRGHDMGTDGTQYRVPGIEAVIWHELAHVAVHQLADGRAPRWVHEGVAQLAQAQVDSIPTEALQIALRGRKVPAIEHLEGHSQELGQTMPMEAGVFYQAAWAQMASLQERLGWAGVGRFLRMLSGGMSTTDAIERLTTLRPDAWHDHWRQWLSERLESPVR